MYLIYNKRLSELSSIWRSIIPVFLMKKWELLLNYLDGQLQKVSHQWSQLSMT